MKFSQQGVDFIKSYEAFSPGAYVCPAGKLTIGYGHVLLRDERGMTCITKEKAEELLRRDLEIFVSAVKTAVKVPLEQHEFDALVSFTYNCGVHNLRKSTLLRKLNAGDRAGAANEFLAWTKSNGKVLPGLTRRREAEKSMFADGAYHNNA